MTTATQNNPKSIYGSRNPAEIPSYAPREAAHYLQLPAATVRTWTMGRKYALGAGERTLQPLLKIADPRTATLSFCDLVELHVLGAMRRDFPIRTKALRKAIGFMRRAYGTDHPLSSRHMLTDGKNRFVEYYGKLADGSEQSQIALKALLEMYLMRIDRNPAGLPIRLYPFTRSEIREGPPKIVAIDPRIQFGRPCIAGTRITTEIIMERYLAGESIQALADDYTCPIDAIEEAIRYETAA